ncbi:hypothetical protein MKY34_20325 [Sporosarcina sp. FSL K6-1522]|uniref:UPF0738 family protein n=1 Tax=Sporosarcina sp. FSL K6-1522 TaxID=2921554 RepID=UPI00315AD09E
MHIKNRVDTGVQQGQEVRFVVAETAELSLGVPSGKMITDSDALSFVYLFDKEEGYQHVHFTQSVWPLMVEALKAEEDPILSWLGNEIQLNGFKEELTMLIYNIEGNHNYGEAFSEAVEQAFSAILQSVE